MIQNVPEHLRQSQRHRFRARRISDHEIGNSVQTVEQKMWIDLRPQRPQLGLGHLLLEQRLTALALDRLFLTAQRVEPVTALRRDGLQIVQVARDERWTLRARRNDEHVSYASLERNGDQNLDVSDGKKFA